MFLILPLLTLQEQSTDIGALFAVLLLTLALHPLGIPPALATSSGEPQPPQGVSGSSQTEQYCTHSIRHNVVSERGKNITAACELHCCSTGLSGAATAAAAVRRPSFLRMTMPVGLATAKVLLLVVCWLHNSPVSANGQVDQPGPSWVPVNETGQVISHSTVDGPL